MRLSLSPFQVFFPNLPATLAAIFVFFLLTTLPVFATQVPSEYQDIDSIMGMQGQVMQGVLRFDLPRTDITDEQIFGVTVLPNLVMDGYASYYRVSSEHCELSAELVLLQNEIDQVTKLLEANFPLVKTTALHNHQFNENHRLFYVHFTGVGGCEALANLVEQAISKTSMPRTNDDNQQDSDDSVSGIDTHAIQSTIQNGTGQSLDGIWEETVDRPGVTQFGHPFKGPMGAEAELHFQPLGGHDQAVVAGEIPLSSSELGPVSQYLRAHAFKVTAVHNHWTDENPRLIVLHIWKQSDAVLEAQELQTALSMTAYH